MITQIMGAERTGAEAVIVPDREARFESAKIMGTDNTIWEITDRKWRHARRAQRLRRERRQKYLTAGLAVAVVICMILICTISYSAINAQANTGFKYYTGVTVESGETLWSIADRYIDYEHYKDKDAYIAEVGNINHIDIDAALLTGQFLIVPYYSAEYVQ